MKYCLPVLGLLLALAAAAPAAPPYRPRTPHDGAAAGRAVTRVDRAEAPAAAPAPTGTARVAVLLIDFSDDAGDVVHTVAYYTDVLFTNAAGKLNHYWRQASRQQLALTGTVDPGGWRRSAHTMAYWGQNSLAGVDDANDAISNLAREAVQLADAAVDFSSFDTDGDSIVDYLVIVHAGSGEEYTGTAGQIYAHSDTIPGGVAVDGVTVSRYILVPEDASLGLLAHEFGHALGLPDLYNTATGDPVVGEWDLMDQGMWNGITPGSTPALPTAWQQILLGWVAPETLNRRNHAGDVLGPWSDTPAAVKLVVSDSEYFLIENRQWSGYDAQLPNEGLLVWHCDDRVGSIADNTINNGATRRVELLEADGTESINNDGGDPFPGTTGKRMLSDTTTPSLRANGGAATGLRIHNIGFTADTATADLYGYDTSPPVITLLAPVPGGCTLAMVQLAGRLTDAAETPALVMLRHNGADSTLAVTACGGFGGPLTLARGLNILRLSAADTSGNSGVSTFGLWLADTLAAAPADDSAAYTAVLTGTAALVFPQGAAETLT
ncbi:MAG TPA: M6 family metalloprotease domain-containing protein, partial [bacterium]|nr:M6 family metalloprotease domain-containing protein [bacterium]